MQETENQNAEELDDLQTAQEQDADFDSVMNSFVANEFGETSETEEPKETEEEPPKEESPKEDQKETKVPVVDDAFIERHPQLSTLKGKDFDEVAKSYAEMQKLVSKVQNENARLKKTEPRPTEKETLTEEEIKDLLDLDPKGQREYLDKLIEKRISEKLKGIETKIEPYQEVVQQKRTEDFLKEVQKNLPEGYEAMKVIDEWKAENKDVLFDEEGNPNEEIFRFYDSHPRKLISELKLYAESKVSKNLAKKEREDAKREVYNQTRKALQTSQAKMPSAPTMRNEPQRESDYVEDAFAEILRRENEIM